MRLKNLIILMACVIYLQSSALTSVNTALIDEKTAEITLSVPAHAVAINATLDRPEIALSQPKIVPEDGAQNVHYQLTTQDIGAIEGTQLQLAYTIAGQRIQETIPLQLSFGFETNVAAEQPKIEQPAVQPPAAAQQNESWTHWITNLMTTTTSLPLLLFLSLLSGLLMSFTPCIYPMIPITAGILQAQATKSLWRNLALSLSYSLGLALTFAMLGMLAAYGGQLFGSLFSHPLFVVAIVALLVYLAFSMMGFYDMYIPRMFQPKHQNVKGGSYLSAFLFGAASGTFASPCVSPGLVSLLSLVSALKSTLMGFLLLFNFGFGLSIPLLIVGSFSSSLELLPRAGMWMVEVKKLFGIMMLFMALYFLAYIVPSHIVMIVAALLCGVCGAWFIVSFKKHESSGSRTYKISASAVSILACVALSYGAYEKTLCPVAFENDLVWQQDFDCALTQAQKEHKHILIDIGAPFCSICTAIDKKMFGDYQVKEALKKHVLVKLDGSQTANQVVTQRYNVLGYPTILLIDENGQEIRRWGAELYNSQPATFIRDLIG